MQQATTLLTQQARPTTVREPVPSAAAVRSALQQPLVQHRSAQSGAAAAWVEVAAGVEVVASLQALPVGLSSR